jgi:hypothetical protein
LLSPFVAIEQAESWSANEIFSQRLRLLMVGSDYCPGQQRNLAKEIATHDAPQQR